MTRDSTDDATSHPEHPPGRPVRLLGVQEVAEMLHVGERYVYRLVSERRIPYLKCGHYVRFDPDEIGSWIDSARVAPTIRPR